MKLLPTASLSNQQKSSCSAMGFIDRVICGTWAAQTQEILLKYSKQGTSTSAFSTSTFRCVFTQGMGRRKETNGIEGAEQQSETGARVTETIYNWLESLLWVICSAAQTAVQVCPAVLHPATQAHQHSRLFGGTSFILGCGNVPTSNIHGDLVLCLESNTGRGKIQVIMTRKRGKWL